MKLITREVGEVITIGDNIKISITRIKSNQVKLSIDAPRDMVIHREEIKRQVFPLYSARQN